MFDGIKVVYQLEDDQGYLCKEAGKMLQGERA